MQASYTLRQDTDRTWSVLLVSTGDPIRLAGIPQTGLSQIEAELTLDILRPKATGAPQLGPAARTPRLPERATA